MPSIQAQYNEEVVQAHREALQALRELLAAEKQPVERRRLAMAILKARPVKDPAAHSETAAAKPAPRRKAETLAELQAITALLETDSADLQRLLTPRAQPSAAAQLHNLAGADRPPLPLASSLSRAVA